MIVLYTRLEKNAWNVLKARQLQDLYRVQVSLMASRLWHLSEESQPSLDQSYHQVP